MLVRSRPETVIPLFIMFSDLFFFHSALANATEPRIQRITEVISSRVHPSKRAYDKTMEIRAAVSLIHTLDPGRFYYTESDIDTCYSLARAGDQVEFQEHPALRKCLTIMAQRAAQLANHTEARLTRPKKMEFSGPLRKALGWDTFARNEAELFARWDIVTDDQVAIVSSNSANSQIHASVIRKMQGCASGLKALADDANCSLYPTAIVRSFDPKGYYLRSEDITIGSSAPILGRPGVHFQSVFGVPEVSRLDLWWLTQSSSVPTMGARVLNVSVGSSLNLDTSLPDVRRLDELLAGLRNARSIQLTIVSPKSGEIKTENIVPFTDDPATLPSALFLSGGARIGYIRLDVLPIPAQGASGVGQLVAHILKSFEETKADGVVLDIRDCYCFDSRQADIVAGALLGPEPYAQVVNAAGDSKLRIGAGAYMYRGPLVVICNRNTRGEAELIAAACADRSRAMLVGETTAGEVGHRAYFNLDDIVEPLAVVGSKRGAICIAHAYDFRLDGSQVQGSGVVPHISVPRIAPPVPMTELEDLRLTRANKVSVTKHPCFLSDEVRKNVMQLPVLPENKPIELTIKGELGSIKLLRPSETDQVAMRCIGLCQKLAEITARR